MSSKTEDISSFFKRYYKSIFLSFLAIFILVGILAICWFIKYSLTMDKLNISEIDCRNYLNIIVNKDAYSGSACIQMDSLDAPGDINFEFNKQFDELLSIEGKDSLSDVIVIDTSNSKKTKNISNGDKINVRFKLSDEVSADGETFNSFEEKYDVRFINTEQSIKITGLRETKKIKLPDGFERYISFKNDNDHGQIDINIPEGFEYKTGDVTLRSNLLYKNIISVIKDDEELAYFYFVCDSDNLKEGDTAEVVSMSNKSIPYSLEPNIIKIKLEDRGEYIDNYEQMTDEYIEQLKKESRDRINYKYGRESIKLLGVFFTTTTDSYTNEGVVSGYSGSQIKIVYEAPGVSDKIYPIVTFRNLIIKNAKLIIDYNNISDDQIFYRSGDDMEQRITQGSGEKINVIRIK